MKKTTPVHLVDGQRFAFTEIGEFVDTWTEFVGYRRTNCETTGERITMIVYRNGHGYKDEIRSDVPVWVFDD